MPHLVNKSKFVIMILQFIKKNLLTRGWQVTLSIQVCSELICTNLCGLIRFGVEFCKHINTLSPN